MTIVKTNLNFHQTFPPDASAISTLLSVAEEETAYTKEEISDITGIPTGKSSGKVEPFIKYAQFMGLLEDEYHDKKHLLKLTSLGKEVKYQDEALQEKATIYLCHSNMVLSSGASLWNFVFSNIFPRYGNKLKMTTFMDALKVQYKVTDVNMSPFYTSYSGMFRKLAVLKTTPEEVKCTFLPFKDAYINIYAYILLKEWESLHDGILELTADDFYAMNVDAKLCLSRSDFDKVLSTLESHGIIKFERLLTPFIVLKLHSSDVIIKHIYSTL